MLLHGPIADRYRDFAAHAAAESPCFEEWALGVARDTEVHAWLRPLPRLKQQPNLVFAAARWHGCPAPAPYAELKRVLLEQEDAVKQTIAERSTQTNEVGRLATLLPVFALIAEESDGPLTLLEAGASAGLCLFPDRYDYVWLPGGALGGSGGPQLTTRVSGPLPVPRRRPRVSGRIGLDLHPLSIADPDAMAWLEVLVWPEQKERRERLRAAVAVARTDPPDVRRGDLLTDLDPLLDEAAEHGTPVVFHTAVVAYLDTDERKRFHDAMLDRVAAGRCRWVANEAPHVLPRVSVTVDRDVARADRFVLGLDGRAVALTHGHGDSIEWL